MKVSKYYIQELTRRDISGIKRLAVLGFNKYKFKQVKKYIDTKILTQYDKTDLAHGLKHIVDVINFAMKLCNKIKTVDRSMVYVAAAYHDLGYKNLKARSMHHIYSGQMVRADINLKKWYDEYEIETIAQACEDHRSSNKQPPRSVYGKIISDADSADQTNIKTLLIRTWYYRANDPTYKHWSDEKIFEEQFEHVVDKYSMGGYQTWYLKETEKLVKKELKITRTYLKNKGKTYKLFMKMKKEGTLKR